MKYDIILVPMRTESGQNYCAAYKTLKKACVNYGISYNTVTSYFRLNPEKISYFHKKTGVTFIKTKYQ